MTKQSILQTAREALAHIYGERLQGIVLYGSEARGDASDESDVDILVLLDRVVDYGVDLRRCLDALYPLALQIGRRISAKPASVKEYETIECPLYRRAHREGIPA